MILPKCHARVLKESESVGSVSNTQILGKKKITQFEIRCLTHVQSMSMSNTGTLLPVKCRCYIASFKQAEMMTI